MTRSNPDSWASKMDLKRVGRDGKAGDAINTKVFRKRRVEDSKRAAVWVGAERLKYASNLAVGAALASDVPAERV